MTSCPRSSRIDGGWSTFSQAVAPPRSGAWIRSRMAPLVNRLSGALASESDHLLAGAPVDRAAQGLEVGLLGLPLGQVGEAPLGETVRRLHHRPVTVVLRAGLAQDPPPMLRIDSPVPADPD